MDFKIVKQRVNDIIKPDSITASDSDFLATHVKMNKLKRPSSFAILPNTKQDYTEDDLFENIIMNPDNKHQMVVVYGQSGSGKSHLIRWFHAMLKHKNLEDEVILFIKRSDNTLKGTIRQLLQMPEVQNIANKDIYDRLTKAQVEVPEDQLKSILYLNFITLIENDEESEIEISRIARNRLSEYLRTKEVQKQLSLEDGPIERIYSKIAENTNVDLDTVAEFKAEDFLDEDFNLEMQNSADISRRTQRVIQELNSDTGKEVAEQYAKYLNTFIPKVIQRCSGIQPGDFGQIFKDIRRELYKQSKNLTLFIEDITSFTGLDLSLLDALMEVHTGLYDENICRISSIIGSTSAYVDSHFRSNHKDRVTDYIYIPDDPFTKTRLYEFFARYLNALSVPDASFKEWVRNGSVEEDYPVCKDQNEAWPKITLKSGQKLSLYPFNERSIVHFYNNLGSGKKTPRCIIDDIIQPVINELLTNRDKFPSEQFNIELLDQSFRFEVNERIKDETLMQRILVFLSVWGDGSPSCYEKNGVLYVSGVESFILEEFNLPILDFNIKETPIVDESEETGSGEIETIAPSKTKYNKDDVNKLIEIGRALQKWKEGETLDASGSAGIAGDLKDAKKRMNTFLTTAINWEAEGISYDSITKISNSSYQFITFQNLSKDSPGFYEMPNNLESQLVIESFCKLNMNRKDKWNYPGAEKDAYIITSWVEKHKQEIIDRVKYYEKRIPYKYVDAAICSEVISEVLNGSYTDSTLKNLEKLLYDQDKKEFSVEGHTRKWKLLNNYVREKGFNNTVSDTVRQYFNIRQGKATATNFVIDKYRLDKELQYVRKCRLIIPEEDLQLEDPIKARKDIYEYYNNIISRLKEVVADERQEGLDKLNRIYECFDDDEFEKEDIDDFCDDIITLMNRINEVQINVGTIDVTAVKNSSAKITEAIRSIEKSRKTEHIIDTLFCYSKNPILTIKKLINLIADLDKCLAKLKPKVEQLERTLYKDGNTSTESDYSEQFEILDESINLFGGEEQ